MDRSLMTISPCHPGELLQTLYMAPLGLSISGLAKKLGVSRSALSSIINGHSAITAAMAVRLGKAFNTSPESWLNAQRNFDVWVARQKRELYENVQPIDSLATLESGRI